MPCCDKSSCRCSVTLNNGCFEYVCLCYFRIECLFPFDTNSRKKKHLLCKRNKWDTEIFFLVSAAGWMEEDILKLETVLKLLSSLLNAWVSNKFWIKQISTFMLDVQWVDFQTNIGYQYFIAFCYWFSNIKIQLSWRSELFHLPLWGHKMMP